MGGKDGMRTRIKRCVIEMVVASLMFTQQARAQSINEATIDTAPRHNEIDSTGVSFSAGSFHYRLPVLSIGSENDEKSLTLTLLYNSGGNRHPNLAWTHSLNSRISRTVVDDPASTIPGHKPEPGWRTYLYNVVLGENSIGFEKLNANPGTSDPFVEVNPNGNTLSFVHSGTGDTSGFYTLVNRNGTSVAINGRTITETNANGLQTFYSPIGINGQLIYNNAGYAILIESAQSQYPPYQQKACSFNLVDHSALNITACPASAPFIIIHWISPNQYHQPLVSAVDDIRGGRYTFEYSRSVASGKERWRLGCVKEPGKASCSFVNRYDECDTSTAPTGASPDNQFTGSRDRVVSHIKPDGAETTYAYENRAPGSCWASPISVTRGLKDPVSGTVVSGKVSIQVNNNLIKYIDELGNITQYGFANSDTTSTFTPPSGLLKQMSSPEGNQIVLERDRRGNIVVKTEKAKSGSGLPDIVMTAIYPANCDNPKTCNKPSSVTDARQNTTSYTYDPSHGGTLTETGPTVNGVQPVKRYMYAQAYAWLKASGAGYVQASTPVWLRTAERSCRTTATIGNGCAGGAADEIVVGYEYQQGNASRPSNLLLVGRVVTADGASLRTCYGYDKEGNRIWETSPRAGLGSCQ